MKSKKIKILLLAPACDETDVSEAYNTYQWVSGIAKRHDVTVLTYSKRNRPFVAPQLPGIRVIEWREWPYFLWAEQFNNSVKPWYIDFYFKAKKYIRTLQQKGEKFDLAHQISPATIRYPSPLANFDLPYILGPLGGGIEIPNSFKSELKSSAWWFYFLRRFDPLRLKYDPLLRNSFKKAAVVIGVAPYVQDILSDIPIKRFEFMCDGGITNINNVSRPLKEPGELKVLFVGRVVRKKGVRDLIRAISYLSDLPRVSLDIVGKGEDLHNCKRETQELKVTQHINFHGHVTDEEKKHLYQIADILIFPTLGESSGNTLLEAMSCGLPVIAADLGGPLFAVNDSCGVLVKVDNPQQYAKDIAEAIRKLALDPALRSRLSKGALERISTTFLWDKKVDWMCNLYRDLLAKRTIFNA